MSEPVAGLYVDAPDVVTPYLHQSLASILINKSPLHCFHKAFGNAEEEYAECTDRGQLAHALLLGGKDIVPVDANDWRTNAAKAMREEARATGKIPVLRQGFVDAADLTIKVSEELKRRGIPLSGQSEVCATWKTDGVWCQGRLDHYIHDSATILDFKFVKSASMKTCINSFINYGYDIQHAAYVQAIETIYPELRGRVTMKFIFIEADAPNAMRVMPVGGTMQKLGSWRWTRALETWRDMLEKYGTETPWPAYSDDGEAAEAPQWALNEQMIQDVIEDGGNL